MCAHLLRCVRSVYMYAQTAASKIPFQYCVRTLPEYVLSRSLSHSCRHYRTLLSQVNSLVLAAWVASSTKSSADNAHYVTLYGGLTAVACILALLRSLLIGQRTLSAAARLHRRIMDTLAHARMSFYDATPSGKIVSGETADWCVWYGTFA